MDYDYSNRSIKFFIDRVSSDKSPVPAGASTSALTGSTGIALLQLILNVSIKNIAQEDKYLKIYQKLNSLKNNMVKLITDDVKAYQANLKEKFSNENFLHLLIEIPLKIANNAVEAMILEKEITSIIKSSLYSDLKVARYNLEASYKGSINIVKANISHFNKLSDDYVNNVTDKIKKLEEKIANEAKTPLA